MRRCPFQFAALMFCYWCAGLLVTSPDSISCTARTHGGRHAVYRDYHGDMFTITAEDCGHTSCDRRQRQAAAIPGEECKCQCAPTHKVFREDIRECVKDIGDCPLAAFVLPYTVERIPLVTLPATSGQLIYPGAHLTMSGVNLSSGSGHLSCSVRVSEILTSKGWQSIAHFTQGRVVFGLFDDSNNVYLQWLGNDRDRRALQQHLVRIRLSCSGEHQGGTYEPCAALRVGWVTGLSAPSESAVVSKQSNYVIIGLCVGVLGLMYVLSLLVYLRTRQARRKRADSAASPSPGDSPKSLESGVQGNGSDHHRTSSHGDRTSAYHMEHNCSRKQECGGVADDTVAHETKKSVNGLHINPELFDPDMLASPPPLAQEFLQRIREMIAAARVRLRNFRFRPTLLVIPEDDYFYQDLKERDVEQVQTQRNSTDHDAACGSRMESPNGHGPAAHKGTSLNYLVSEDGRAKDATYHKDATPKTRLESIHGTSPCVSDILRSTAVVNPPQPPPRNPKSKLRKSTPIVSRKEAAFISALDAHGTRDYQSDAHDFCDDEDDSPELLDSEKDEQLCRLNMLSQDSKGGGGGPQGQSGDQNLSKFDVFRHELYVKLQKLHDNQGTSSLNIPLRKERPRLLDAVEDGDGATAARISHANDEATGENGTDERQVSGSPQFQVDSTTAPGRPPASCSASRNDTPKPPATGNSGKSQKHAKISRRELLQKIQEQANGQFADFDAPSPHSDDDPDEPIKRAGTAGSTCQEMDAPRSISSTASCKSAVPMNDTDSWTMSSRCSSSSFGGNELTSTSYLVEDGGVAFNADSLEEAATSEDDNSLYAESYVTSSETLPPMSSENETRRDGTASEKCSLSSMATTPTESLRSSGKAAASRSRRIGSAAMFEFEFQNNLDRGNAGENVVNGAAEIKTLSLRRSSSSDQEVPTGHDTSRSFSDNEPRSLDSMTTCQGTQAHHSSGKPRSKPKTMTTAVKSGRGSSEERAPRKTHNSTAQTSGGPRIGADRTADVGPNSNGKSNKSLKRCTAPLGRHDPCGPAAYSSESDTAVDGSRRAARSATTSLLQTLAHCKSVAKLSGKAERKHKSSSSSSRKQQKDTGHHSDAAENSDGSSVTLTNSRTVTPSSGRDSRDSSLGSCSIPIGYRNGGGMPSSEHHSNEIPASTGQLVRFRRGGLQMASSGHSNSNQTSSGGSNSIEPDSLSIASSDDGSKTGEDSPRNGFHRKCSTDSESSSFCDSMTEDSLNINGYSSDNDSSDENNPIDACLTQLANTPITADGAHPFKIDRATKGLDTIQMIKTAGWKHICHDMKAGQRSKKEHGSKRNGYQSDDTVSSTSSRSSTGSRCGSGRKSKRDDDPEEDRGLLSHEVQHVSRMLGYFSGDFTSDSNATYSSNTDEETATVPRPRRGQSGRGQDVHQGTSEESRRNRGESKATPRNKSAATIPSTSEEETTASCSEDTRDEESDGLSGSSASRRSTAERGDKCYRRRTSHAGKTKKALNGNCKQHVQNRNKNQNSTGKCDKRHHAHYGSGSARHTHKTGILSSSSCDEARPTTRSKTINKPTKDEDVIQNI